MELLSNRVLDPFLSRIDGESIDLLEGSRSLMEGEREREFLFYFGRARMSRRKKIAVGEEEDGYKYP